VVSRIRVPAPGSAPAGSSAIRAVRLYPATLPIPLFVFQGHSYSLRYPDRLMVTLCQFSVIQLYRCPLRMPPPSPNQGSSPPLPPRPFDAPSAREQDVAARRDGSTRLSRPWSAAIRRLAGRHSAP